VLKFEEKKIRPQRDWALQLTKCLLIPATSFDVLKLSGHLKWLYCTATKESSYQSEGCTNLHLLLLIQKCVVTAKAIPHPQGITLTD
jgi:hypothetical protein